MNAKKTDAEYSFEDFASIRHYSFFDFLTYDPAWITYADDTTCRYNLWKYNLDGSIELQSPGANRQVQMTYFIDKVVRAAFPSPIDQRIIFFADHQGNENHQIYCIDTDGYIKPITENPDVRYEWGAQCFSNDARYIIYGSNERDPSNLLLYIRDLKQNDTFCITDKPGWYIPGYWSTDNKMISCLEILNETDSSVWIVDVDKRRMVKTVFGQQKNRNELGPWSSHDFGFYILTDINREYRAMVFYNTFSSELNWISEPRFDIESINLSKDGRLLVWSTNENGYSKMYRKDLVTGQIWQLQIQKGVIQKIKISPDAKTIGFSMSTPTSPTNIYILNLQTDKIDKITSALLSNIPAEIMVEPEILSYTSFDGLEISFLLYAPRNIGKTQKAGCVLSIHGGPISQERPKYAYEGLYQYLTNKGIAVMAPDYRGSTGYGRSFEKKIYHDWGGAELKDLEYAAKWLISQQWIDETRLGVFGASFGGYAVLNCITRLPKYWKAAVDMFGPANLVTAITTAPGHWRNADKDLIGDPEKERDFLLKRSPILYIENIKADLLILQGANDPRVIRRESDEIVQKLKISGKNVEYIIFGDEGHGFTSSSNKLNAYKIIADFLVNRLS